MIDYFPVRVERSRDTDRVWTTSRHLDFRQRPKFTLSARPSSGRRARCERFLRINKIHEVLLTGHYKLDASSPEIAAAFGVDAGPDPWAGGALFPGTFAPVIARAGRTGKCVIRPMHWGYPPPGASTEALGPEPPRWVAQVRNIESPFWIGNLRHTELRCLIPATAFALRYGGKEHWHAVRDRPLFAMAGIWRDLTDMPVFAVLTTEPNSALLPVEGGKGPSAMPLILHTKDHYRWLHADWKEAQSLVEPFPARDTASVSDGKFA